MSDSTIAVLTLAHVKRVGTDDNFRSARAQSVVDAAPEGFDWTARGAVPAAILSAMGLSEHPEPQKVGPKGAQKETVYGIGFRVLADAVRKIVKDDGAPKPAVLRVTMSGEGGGSTIVPVDHPLYAALVDLLASESESE